MLGSNLGKKVTAGVVQDQYKQYLNNDKKKPLTPEERREAKRVEMRHRGIFVKADDPDETPTILEKSDGVGQPMTFVLPEKPTMWKTSKKTATRKHIKNKKSKKTDASEPSKKRKPKSEDASLKFMTVKEKPLSTATPTSDVEPTKRLSAEKAGDSVEEKEEKKEVEKKDEEKKEPTAAAEPETPKPSVLAEPVAAVAPVELEKEKAVEKTDEPKTAIPEQPTTAITSTKTMTQPVSRTPKSIATDKQYASLTAVSSNPSLTEMKKNAGVPLAEKQPEAFEKLDDDEFEKMTSDADEKEMLKLAPRLLKVAKRHAAIEKCLTSDENDTLAKFFSGKQKLDSKVLATLDSALDKIIDYLQKNNCTIDEETKTVMKKRDKLKAAMMKEFLVSPQYLPKTWTAKFNEWKAEAEKQKNGVNWFRVLFSYPKHKSFDDGPEDSFGNFRRHNRPFWIGVLLGPGDVKSFEETKREEDCQGMFLDTKIIENAATTNTVDKDTVSSFSTNTAPVSTASLNTAIPEAPKK